MGIVEDIFKRVKAETELEKQFYEWRDKENETTSEDEPIKQIRTFPAIDTLSEIEALIAGLKGYDTTITFNESDYNYLSKYFDSFGSIKFIKGIKVEKEQIEEMPNND